MLSPPLAVEVLRDLPADARVVLPCGARGFVLAPDHEQPRTHVKVLVGGCTVRTVERWQCEPVAYTEEDLAWFRRPITDGELRSLGRTAYRGRGTVDDAIKLATDVAGRELTTIEQLLVMDGWAAERAEVSL